jgi:hypothetical protein
LTKEKSLLEENIESRHRVLDFRLLEMSQSENKAMDDSSLASNLSRLDINHSSESGAAVVAATTSLNSTDATSTTAARKSTTFQQIRVHSKKYYLFISR